MQFTYEKPDNLVEVFETAVSRFGNNLFLGTKDQNNEYSWLTYSQIGQYVNNLRASLADKEIGAGNTVGFIGNNRWEWAVAAFATYGRKARFVPMYEYEKPQIWKYIIEHSEVNFLIVSKPEIAQQIREILPEPTHLKYIFVIDTQEKDGSFASLIADRPSVASLKPEANDIAVLIYTSGTTGEPKGVLLSHGNLSSNARAGYNLFKKYLTEKAVSLSILPWAHSYGQVAELYNWLQFGGRIGFMESVEKLAANILEVRPTFLLAVPRIFNRIYDGIHRKMAEEGGIKLKLFNNAVRVASKRRALHEKGESSAILNIQYAFYDKLVLSKIRDRFGGRLDASLTASATMNVNISKFFWDIGIPVLDAYGLTETSPALSMNSPEHFCIGSVGRPLEHITLKIDKSVTGAESSDGEIIAYGPNIMHGYYKNAEATKEVMTDDGGFRTGDRGRLDENGFLFITGRIKEQYKLVNGKYVFPASIEEEIKTLPYVLDAMIFGDGKDYNVALIVPDFEIINQWAKTAHLHANLAEIIDNKSVQAFIDTEIQSHLRSKYGGYEIPKKYTYIKEPFTLENGMLTQTMKLKRPVVIKHYQEVIDSMYEQ